MSEELRCPCPRCCGWVEPTVLVGKEDRRWQILRASHCVNCGWYGGEPILDQRAALAASQRQLALVGTAP